MKKQFVSITLSYRNSATKSASLQIKLSEVKQCSFYLDSILPKHLNNLLPPIPLSSAAFKDFAKNFFRNKISTQKRAQNLKIVHYTPTLSEDILPSQPTKKILAFLECLKTNGRISAEMLPL